MIHVPGILSVKADDGMTECSATRTREFDDSWWRELAEDHVAHEHALVQMILDVVDPHIAASELIDPAIELTRARWWNNAAPGFL